MCLLESGFKIEKKNRVVSRILTVVFKLMFISRILNGHDLPQLFQKEVIK